MTGARWIGSKDLTAIWMNRKQTSTSISVCKPPEYHCIDVQQDKSMEDWVGKIPDPVFDKTGTSYLAVVPFPDGDRGRFPQVCQGDTTNRKYLFLTEPPIVVLEISAWDLENHLV